LAESIGCESGVPSVRHWHLVVAMGTNSDG
jgi:hypothetical protein